MNDTRLRTHHGRVIDTETRIHTTPEQAWKAWADPQEIANWFVDRAEGVAAPGEVMTWFFDTFNYRLPVPIIEAEPGATFVTGGGDQPGPHGLPYLMEISITKDAGTTTVRLVNSGFSPDAKFDDEVEGVVSGWKMALATMKHYLENFAGRRRTHLLVIEPASYTWDTLHPLFHTAEGRRTWIEPMMPWNAATLALTGREVLLDWPERAGVLGLKAFRMGPQTVVALDFSSWSLDESERQNVSRDLNDAIRRLKSAIG
jgi:uncharacterized protein YndB with AHSA1/START domain